MKCKDCHACRKGFFQSKPEAYVCIGVKEPFVIDDINVGCTEYPEKNERIATLTMPIAPTEPAKAYVGDKWIYVPSDEDYRYCKLLISKELFIEAYNKWIKGEDGNEE